MQQVIVSNLIDGKILAENVYNKNGQLLLKAGYRLSLAIINRLNKEEIRSVWVE